MKHFFASLLLFSIIHFTASATDIDAPRNLKVESLSPTQVKIFWQGSIDDYCYIIRIKPTTDTAWTKYFMLSPCTNRRINGLKPSTTYEWEIKKYGWARHAVSPFRKGQSFTTFSDCSSPGSITMVRSGIDYLIVNWENNGGAKYAVQLREAGTQQWNTYYTQNNIMRIDALQPYTDYEVQVSSFCFEDATAGSPYSAPETFTTHTFLQNDFQRMVYNEAPVNISSSFSKDVADAHIINQYGDLVTNIKPACISAEGIYFDIDTNIQSGIYTVQIPGTEGKRMLVW